MYRYKTYFFALLNEVVDSFLSRLGDRTHGYDDAFGIGSSVVVEQAVFATGDFGYLVHVLFDDGGHRVVVLVARFAVLEEYVAVFSHTAGHGVGGAKGACAEVGDCFMVNQRSKIVVIEHFDFLYFVRCAETVKEVDERHA